MGAMQFYRGASVIYGAARPKKRLNLHDMDFSIHSSKVQHYLLLHSQWKVVLDLSPLFDVLQIKAWSKPKSKMYSPLSPLLNSTKYRSVS